MTNSLLRTLNLLQLTIKKKWILNQVQNDKRKKGIWNYHRGLIQLRVENGELRVKRKIKEII